MGQSLSDIEKFNRPLSYSDDEDEEHAGNLSSMCLTFSFIIIKLPAINLQARCRSVMYDSYRNTMSFQ